jgi:hypothetical protein
MSEVMAIPCDLKQTPRRERVGAELNILDGPCGARWCHTGDPYEEIARLGKSGEPRLAGSRLRELRKTKFTNSRCGGPRGIKVTIVRSTTL